MITYYDESILSYVASIRDYFGLSSSYKPNQKLSDYIKTRKPSKVFLLLIDGMGANLIENKLDKDSFLRKNMFCKTKTVFPSSTVPATTSIRNGKSPNENAWLGWMQYIKEIDDTIIPFLGVGYYNEKEYGRSLMFNLIPTITTVEQLNAKAIKARELFPAFMEDGCKDLETMCSRLIDYSKSDEYKYIYAYWDEFDQCMHDNGPNSRESVAYLKRINSLIDNLASSLSDDTLLIVTADHGQIEVKEEYNLYNSKFDKYFIRKPSLEFRAMTFFIKDGMQDEFETEFKKEFEDSFVLFNHKQVLEMQLFGQGNNHPRFEEFFGDFIAVGKSNTVLAYKENEEDVLKGQHGGMCNDEMYVPIITYQK